MPIIFSGNIHTEFLSIEDADEELINLFKELSDINKGKKPIVEKPFLGNRWFLLDAKEKVPNSFESNISPLKNSTPELTPNPAVFDTPKPTKDQN